MMGDKHRLLISRLLGQGEVVMYNNSVYLFVPTTGCWHQVISNEGLRYICDLLGMDKVTVNYETAVAPYLSTLERAAPPCGRVPLSVCIGTMRLKIQLSDSGIQYTPCEDITQVTVIDSLSTTSMRMISAFVFMPLLTSRIPRYLPGNKSSVVCDILSFSLDERQMSVILWCIGNALVDHGGTPRLLYFYGQGDGKTTAINSVTFALTGAVQPLTTDYIGRSKDYLKDEDIEIMMNSRMVTFGDCRLIDGYKLNDWFLKILTGADMMSLRGSLASVRCTGLFGSNQLWYPSPGIMDRWFTRRMIIIRFRGLKKDARKPTSQFNDVDKTHFAHRCIHEFLSYERPPIDIRMALETTFGTKINNYTRGIRIEENASPMTSLVATQVMASFSKLEISHLCDMLSAMRSELVSEYNGVPYVKNLGIRLPSF